MPTPSSIDLAIASISMLADSESLEKVQVQRLLRIAFEDGVLDDSERGVLKQVFDHLNKDKVEPETWDLVSVVRFKYKF